ncbi:hypothetical protein ACH5RR_019951 [Cinchona calisaya]|uniref:INO80 complex subunit B-like conserved region domain-containing protein n=1 Tax=Cinchona calisaya TaxID=153742 RepID=A0ABD2ZD00_9GENT
MEDLCGSRFDGLGIAVRKKRSQTSRRPRPEPQVLSENHDLSSIPISDDTGKVSGDENTGDAKFRGKIFSLSQCMSRGPSTSRDGDNHAYKKIKESEDGATVPHSIGRVGDGADYGLAVDRGSLGLTGDSIGNENKLKKVKLKVGGVTRTIQTKSSSNGVLNIGISTKTARFSDVPRARQKLILQDTADHSALDKKSGLQGTPLKDFSRGRLNLGKEDIGKMVKKNGFEKLDEKSDPVRKSKRVPKRRVLDGAFDEDDSDDELRYLEKIRIPKAAGYRDFDVESTKEQRNISRVSKGGKYENLDEGGKSSKDGKRSRSDRGSEDTDYEEEVEMPSDGEPEAKKKQRKDPSDLTPESKREITLTTRQRALLSSKDASSISGASQIEFPNGLPPPPPRKQKEKLTEVELQLKKAEAAQRRRMQSEKAARESEAEAIRKILGQDSSRKKREDRMKKRQEELAQEKAATAQMLASKTIRWVMGPTGTVVTFPQEMGLPKIFDPKLSSYPPPREKCAGPSCTNAYKYRDSRTKLPLCSLQCYKAINTEMQQAKAAC